MGHLRTERTNERTEEIKKGGEKPERRRVSKIGDPEPSILAGYLFFRCSTETLERSSGFVFKRETIDGRAMRVIRATWLEYFHGDRETCLSTFLDGRDAFHPRYVILYFLLRVNPLLQHTYPRVNIQRMGSSIITDVTARLPYDARN